MKLWTIGWWMLALLAAPAAAQGGVALQRFDPSQDVGIDQRLGEHIPLDLEFRDERGQTVKLASYFGKKPVVLALVYYQCPMLCTLVLNDLVRALRALPLELGRDFEIVTVSIDPRETPQLAATKKASYVETYGRDGSAWHFLVGDEASIGALARAIGFRYVYDAEADQYAHAAGLIVATPEGVLSRYLYGVEYAPRDLRLALVEAGDGRVGGLADQVLMLCFHYDPTTGKYGFAIMSALRIAGVATVVVLVAFMLRSLRRERRGRSSEAHA
jgi:protein SCO1/2